MNTSIAEANYSSPDSAAPTALRVKPKDSFVVSPQVEAICNRALAYLEAGYPVHLSGAAGTGKTTLALHLAGLRRKPVALIHGDDEFGTSDLIGGEHGYRMSRVMDNFIHSVLKTEESVRRQWVDNRLTTACKCGWTLVYDEFTRSRPEANNVLLAILEEKILEFPKVRFGETYMPVHADFRAIFTSNPEEYAGVHKTQDALLDRMITIDLSHYDRETEIAITSAKSGLPESACAKVVDLVRDFRHMGVCNFRPTVRACIMIARVLAHRGGQAAADDPLFLETCFDVLGADLVKIKKEGVSVAQAEVRRLVAKHC